MKEKLSCQGSRHTDFNNEPFRLQHLVKGHPLSKFGVDGLLQLFDVHIHWDGGVVLNDNPWFIRFATLYEDAQYIRSSTYIELVAIPV